MELHIAREAADKVLAGLSQTNSEGLRLDEDGVCRLVFESGGNVYVVLDAASDDLVVWTPAGVLPPEGQAEILRGLMRANLFWAGTNGATLSLAPDDETVVLARRVPLPGLDSEHLSGVIEQTVDDAAHFNVGLAFSSEPTEAETPEFDPRDTLGMIRG